MKEYKGQQIYPTKDELREGWQELKKNITIERGFDAVQILGKKRDKKKR